MRTFQIHFNGQVQGVGFRPFVFELASRMGLSGTVSNGTDGVTILLNGSKKECYAFYHELLFSPPANARITNHSIEEVADLHFDGFSIVPSTADGKPSLTLTPDLALCDSCRRELHDFTNRRYQYPFTTCLNCGPRYSIIQRLPYDRENTTMVDFKMCDHCDKEFNDPLDKRHYSQTNSCPNCAITMSFLDSEGNEIESSAERVIDKAIEFLNQGKILAVKGIGGFLLMCDAGNAKTIITLRERKHRPAKPLALLYPSLQMLRKDAWISAEEQKLLTGKQAPILLLRMREAFKSAFPYKLIAPHLNKIGVVLPYAPLLEMLTSRLNKPLIATSANVSNSPILFTNEKAVNDLKGIADGYLINNRDIVVPQDDSVVQVTPSGESIFLRRSRGYAPTYLPQPFFEKTTTLAMGGDLKSAFAINEEGRLLVSQYLGDLASYDTQESFRHTLGHLMKLFETRLQRILVDKHPQYFSTTLGSKLADELKVELLSVQHHKAHFSAVLAENNLLTEKEGVLGVVWDGTGWGDDHAIWGGEFFEYKDFEITRVEHLEYYDHLLGDKMSIEPRLSALSLCQGVPKVEKILKPKFSEQEWDLYSHLAKQGGEIKTSSMGRLFDGVSSLLGLNDKSSYEGEAALYLESLAEVVNPNVISPWYFRDQRISPRAIVEHVITDLERKISREEIAYRFHLSLVDWVDQVALQQSYAKMAFSGGVFQNALLVEMLHKQLGEKYELFFHRQLSPNDECIGFGQLAYQHIQTLKLAETEIPEEFEMVLKL